MKQSSKIPSWLSWYLQANDLLRIEKAVEQAERTTSAEIVPMVVRRSSTVGHVPVIILCISAILISYILPRLPFSGIYLWMIMFASLLFAVLLSIVLSRVAFMQRLLTNRADRISQVQMRAEVEFYEAGLERTVGRTGILIFISLMDRHIVVLGDKAIAAKLPQEAWISIVGILAKRMKSGELGAGLCEAISECEKLVSPYFTAQNTQNELFNKLIIKE